MRCVLGIMACAVTHALFVWTVWQLYWFLAGAGEASAESSLALDAGVAILFGAAHSVFLHPAVREKLSELIAPAFYGLFYCVATCASLLTMFGCWQHSSIVIWEFAGPWRTVIQAVWFGSWTCLLYSLRLSGWGYQTGWTPWWHWFRGRPIPPRPFAPRGLYLYLRHPVYLSFLGLVWFTPAITADRLVLIATWTPYVLLGSYLKDERMAYYLGETYRHYQAWVPGFPGLSCGPLGIRPLTDDDACDEVDTAAVPATGRQHPIAIQASAGAAERMENSLCSHSR